MDLYDYIVRFFKNRKSYDTNVLCGKENKKRMD